MRVTLEKLFKACDKLNELTRAPITTWGKGRKGETIGMVGNYHIATNKGQGVSLKKVILKDGTTVEILGDGGLPKKELFERLRAFETGMVEYSNNPDLIEES